MNKVLLLNRFGSHLLSVFFHCGVGTVLGLKDSWGRSAITNLRRVTVITVRKGGIGTWGIVILADTISDKVRG